MKTQIAAPSRRANPSPSYVTLPTRVAEAAIAGELFLVCNGYINVQEAQNQLAQVKLFLANAEVHLSGRNDTLGDAVTITYEASRMIEKAGWHWGRYLHCLRVLGEPKHHPPLPKFLSGYPAAMEHWTAGIRKLASRLSTEW
jgi:hypothetical protein